MNIYMQSEIKRRLKENSVIENNNTICQFPKNMLIEITNSCNDSCLFCANSKCTKKRGMIKKDLAIKILKEAYELGTREVGFYGTGEPLLDNHLETYISYAKQLGYEYVYITTNGALLSEERAISIIEAGIDSVKFSINASNARDYYLIHGRDEFDRVIENLIRFDMLRKQKNKKISLYISYIATRYTNQAKDEFKTKYEKYVDDIVLLECRNISGCMSDEIKEYLSVDQKLGIHPENNICPIIFKNLYVTYEGYLTMCCADFQNYLVVADLNKENLKEAWNNKYARNLRKRHLEHNLEGTLCFNCIYDCNKAVEPLIPTLAEKYDHESWIKRDEIESRIKEWELT